MTKAEFLALSGDAQFEVYERVSVLLEQALTHGNGLYEYAVCLEAALQAKATGQIH